MAHEFIKVEKQEHVTLVTINRPEVMNALHPPACQEMDAVFNEFSQDPEAWVAVITGAGDKAFCAGNDLKWQALHGAEALRKGLDQLKGGWGGITHRFDCYKPLIAAVNGFALGGGFELVLACDLVIAAEHATFALPEPRVGMIAAAGGVLRLPQQLPYHLAMGYIFTGRRMSAQEAHRLGIANEVVPLSDLMNATKRWVNEILSCAPLAIRASKESYLKGLANGLKEALNTLYPGTKAMRESEDYREGPKAFAEKRKPQWKGR